jgi:hypothetical protein
VESKVIDRFPSKNNLINIKTRDEIEEKLIKRLKINIKDTYFCNQEELAL